MALKSAHHEPERSEVIEEALDELDKTLDRLRVMYEQYFLGIQKQAPAYIHLDVERKIRDLTQLNIRNTGLRYRYNTLQQKFGSYNSYWRRTLRQIEQGTYVRSLAKLGRKVAKSGEEIPEEILAAMPKLMRERVKRDRDAAVALAKRQNPQAGGFEREENTQEDLLTLDGGDGREPDAAAFVAEPSQLRREIRKGGAIRLDENDDFDIDAFFAEASAEEATSREQTGVRVPTPAPGPAPGPAKAPLRHPSAQAQGAPGASVSSSTRAGSSTSPPPLRSTPPPLPQRPSQHSTVTAPPQRPGDQLPGLAQQRPPVPPRPTGQQPPLPRPGGPPPPPAARQTGPSPIVAQPPAGVRQTGPSPIAQPGVRQTGPSPITQPGVRQTGPSPIAQPPRPTAPSQSARPLTIAPGSTANRTPVPVQSVGGRGTPERDAGATPKPAMRPPPGMSDGDVDALYNKYVKAKAMVGEQAGPQTREKLLRTINAQAPKIMEQYKAAGVDFSIVVKDNQVIIRAKPKP